MLPNDPGPFPVARLQYVVLVGPASHHPPVLLQAVPEPRTAKSRVHFDIRTPDVPGEVARLEHLGARRVDVGQGEGDRGW